MSDTERSLLEGARRYIRSHRDVIVSVFLAFVISHGTLMLQKVSVHDDMGHLFDIGATYSSGRWSLGLLEALHRLFFGNVMWSLPLLNSLTVCLLTACTVCLLSDQLGLCRRVSRILFAVLFAACPGMISMLGYMFTAPAYSLGVLTSVGAGILLVRGLGPEDGRIRFTPLACGVLAGVFSLGIYQSYIAFTLTIVLIGLIRFSAGHAPGAAIRRVLAAGLCAAVMFVLYLGVMALSMRLTGTELSSYRGMDSAAQTPVGEYFSRCALAYREFFFPRRAGRPILYPFHSWWIYMALLVLGVLVFIPSLLADRSVRSRGIVLLLTLLIPPAVEFSYLLTDSGHYAMMFYASVLPLGALLALTEHYLRVFPERELIRVMRRAFTVLLASLSLFYVRYAGQAALKAEYLQMTYSNYVAVLSARIQSTPGYTVSTPVLLANTQHIRAASMPEEFRRINIYPYWDNPLAYSAIRRYRVYMYLQQWSGFTAPYVEEDSLSEEGMERVKAMPYYPDDGSIEMIEGILVVKF